MCTYDIVLQGLEEDPLNKGAAGHRKRRETNVRVGQRLARASNVLPAFLSMEVDWTGPLYESDVE